MAFEELRDLILEMEWAKLKSYKRYFREPDPDRALLLTAHLVTESFLESMISTRVPQADAWLKEADFRSKLNLAKALCLVGPRVVAICSVLNKARNEMAHTLKPLSSKWKLEFERLAYGSAKRRKENKVHALNETLEEMFLNVAGAWAHAKFHKNIAAVVDQHSERWTKKMATKIKEHVLAGDYVQGDPKLGYEVTLELLRELRQEKP